jgi:hypothetical protein
MREIKFRAYCKEINRMVNFKVGEIPHWYNEVLLEEEELGWDSLSEPMQYTGVKDKNGKEIYEGDIVSVVNMHDENIQWWANGLAIPFTIEWRCHAFELPSSEEDISFNWEVTGNIHDQLKKLTVKEGNKSNSSQG